MIGITGTIYLTNDKNIASNFVMSNPTNNIVVCISQNALQDQLFIQNTGALIANVLTPPYECFMREVNGDKDGFIESYYAHLSRPECSEYIAAILKALVVGKNIMLYQTPDESETSYADIFRTYMLQLYGICIGDQTVQFMWYRNTMINVAIALYRFDLLTSTELFDEWKVVPMVDMPEDIILKLINELKPSFGKDLDISQYNELFKTMAVGNNNGQFVIPARVMK